MEVNGYLPFDNKHRTICERVLELTGKDYQQPLKDYYYDHDIHEEFDLNEFVEEDGRVFDHQGQAGNEGLEPEGNDQGYEEGLIESADTTDESFPAQAANTTEDDGSVPTATQEAQSKHDNHHVHESQEVFSGAASPVPPIFSIPVVTPKPETSQGPEPSKPIFESTGFSNPFGSNGPNEGRNFEFGFRRNPRPAFVGTPDINFLEIADNRSISHEVLKVAEPAGATKPSAAVNGNSHDFWSGTSFPTGENNPFSPKTMSAADLRANSNKGAPIFNTFSTPPAVEATTSVSESPEPKQGSETTKTSTEGAVGTTKGAFIPTQLQTFNFGDTRSPVTFTGSTSSSSAGVLQPASIPCEGQHPPPKTLQAKEKAAEDSVAEDEIANEEVSKVEPPKGKAPEDETSSEEGTPKKATPEASTREHESSRAKKTKKQKQKSPESESNSQTRQESPISPTLRRNKQRAAKKAQEKAARKAEREAENAKVREKRRVQQAMMMR